MKQQIFWVTFFAIGMAFVESSVVVYLRELYYPGGFDFPLRVIDSHIAITEFLREAATLVMLLGVAVLASKKRAEIPAWFIYTFAIWDIFYYVFLKAILNWPASLLTWDLLFLIPLIWTGPVVAPMINSITMIILALVILHFSRKGYRVSIQWQEWALIIIGCLITITAYTMDYFNFISSEFSLREVFSFSRGDELMQYTANYVPVSFNWYVFVAGEMLFFITIWLYARRLMHSNP
ncbi:MAG: hypothetical protein K8R63_11015 [Bacteroidales bacterium]|nr:hypothetical protein [Bacteroidales bacterium]